jgi:hypothetical protein
MTEYNSTEQRPFIERKERKKFGLPIILLLDNNTIELPARLYDISHGGASFKSNVEFPVGEVLEIIIPYPAGALLPRNKKEPIKLKVEVRWCNDFNDEQDFLVRYVHGCKLFDGNNPETADEVNKLIGLSDQLGTSPLRY